MRSFIGPSDFEQSTSNTSNRQDNPPQASRGKTRARKMQHRAKVINKLALVLLSIVVLELILIGDQVQPVKGIKKKIYLKKLKKLLPLLALVKPKKKIILLPVSFLYPPTGKNHFARI